MNKPYLSADFMLETERGRDLYHSYAERLPIIDYHCHLSPKDIAEDRRFENLTQAWLAGDHYKWRAMRACGVPERFITGDASDWEKFEKWAETVPKTLRNPLYHWTHLELKRPFGIDDRLLDPTTARGIWDECQAKLAAPEFSTRGILRRMNVEVVCTTDDPVDDLRYHNTLRTASDFPVRVFPAFRPDKALAVDNPEMFKKYVELLSRAADIDVRTYADFLAALRKRHDEFHALGCRVSDHGLETIDVELYTDAQVRKTFASALAGKPVAPYVAAEFRSALLYEFAVMDWEKGWVQQYHLGALRNTNSRMMSALGPDTGYDSIGEFELALPLADFLDRLEAQQKLAKTIVFNANPGQSEALATLIGSFQDGATPGKMQYGPAWWFLDQLDGMTRQVEVLSSIGLLSQFVGMTTDSRSFLSYPRHEYFRRLLCNILGREMTSGLLPDDRDLVGGMVKNIGCLNAKRYFPFPARTGSSEPPLAGA
jgi:glucuronate isomerase